MTAARLSIGRGFTLPHEAVTQTFAILAKRGAGKTYTAAVLTEELLEAELPVVVVDPIGVWHGLRTSANGKGDGYPIHILGGDHGDVPLEATGGSLVAELVVDERVPLVLDLSRFRKGEQVRFMTDFAETLYRRNREPLHLIIDEADSFAPQRPMHDQARLLGAMEDLVRRGRARGIGMTMVTQRAAVLAKNVLTQIEVLVVLRTVAPQDRAAIEAWVEQHGTPEQAEELLDSLPSLPIGTAWFWSPGWLDVFQRVQVRKRRTFDSSSTPEVGVTRAAPRRLAPVDLDALQARMAETIERAKADDPKALRARITALERELAAKPKAAPPERVEVPALRPADVERVERGAAKLEQLAEKLDGQVKALLLEASELRKKLPASAEGERRIAHADRVTRDTSPRPTGAPSQVRVFADAVPNTRAGRPPTPPRKASSRGDGTLSVAERAFLTVLARREGKATTRNQVAVLAGYSAKSRHVDNVLGALRSAGHVEGGRDGLTITTAGTAALGELEPLPTGHALVEYWARELGAAGGAMLRALVDVHPRTMTRDELAEATGYSTESRHVDNTIGALRTRDLITGSRVDLRASDELFP